MHKYIEEGKCRGEDWGGDSMQDCEMNAVTKHGKDPDWLVAAKLSQI